MKKISPSEMLQLRELMQMEANALAMARVTHHVIQIRVQIPVRCRD